VIATIWFDLILWFLVGSLVRGAEWVGRRVPPTRLGGRHLVGAAIGMLCFAEPASIYSYLRAPDWAWMYWVDPRTLAPGVAILVTGIGNALAFCAGAAANAAASRAVGIRGGAAVHGIGLCALAVLTVVGWTRLMHVGDRIAFAAGAAEPLWQSRPLFPIFLALGAAIGGVVGLASFSATRRRRAT
jgi:hypothetical protein